MKFKVGDEVMHVRNIDLCGIVDGGGSNKHWEVKLHSGEHRTFHEADLMALPTPISSKMKFEVGDRVFVQNSFGEWFQGRITNRNDFREPGMKYAIDLDRFEGGPIFAGEDEIVPVAKTNQKENK